MRRLYFLVEDIDCVRRVVEGLLLARVEERHIHVIAKEGVALEALPEASLLQKSDFVPAVERGIAIGGATGILAGLVAMAFPGGPVVGGGALLATGLLGVGMGAWLSGMIGMDVPNTRLRQFESAIEKGEFLLLVDIPKRRVGEIEALIKEHYQKAMVEGTEPTIPAFP